MRATLGRRITAEALGTALLLAVVVGSGIMGERLAGGNVAVALLANTLATGAGLVALIHTFGPISGAHLNPAVTVADAALGGLRWPEVPAYVAAQVIGAFLGVAVSDAMFGEPLFSASQHVRAGGAQFLSEFVATFGLLSVIWGVARRRATAVPLAVGAYITAAYWFTASTSFANPAVTMARAATDTFAGIRPADVPAFIAAQCLGTGAATILFRWLVPALPNVAPEVLVPHSGRSGEAGLPQELSMEHGEHPTRVLFLCTGNSARSVFSEYFLRKLGGKQFESYSAGANPSGVVNPYTLRVLRERFAIDASDARSKSWQEFENVKFDFVITVCDKAREACPVWPGQPIVAHWGVEDPAAFAGSPEDTERFFYSVARILHRRVQLLTSLPLEKLSRLKLEKLTRDIGKDHAVKVEKAAGDQLKDTVSR